MRVILQVDQDAASALQQRQASDASPSQQEDTKSRELLDAAAELGVRVEPLHPGQTDPLLASYFMVEVPDRETADRVVDRLSRLTTVQGAYLKPEEQLP